MRVKGTRLSGGIPTIIITIDRKTRKPSVRIENFEGVPAVALDRIDITIERELYLYNLTQRHAAAQESRESFVHN